MKTKIKMLMILFLALWGIQAMNGRMVKGKVTSASDGSALSGVNVLLKGTTASTVTNQRGEYSVFIPG